MIFPDIMTFDSTSAELQPGHTGLCRSSDQIHINRIRRFSEFYWTELAEPAKVEFYSVTVCVCWRSYGTSCTIKPTNRVDLKREKEARGFLTSDSHCEGDSEIQTPVSRERTLSESDLVLLRMPECPRLLGSVGPGGHSAPVLILATGSLCSGPRPGAL